MPVFTEVRNMDVKPQPRITFFVTDSMHSAFKIKAAKAGQTMSERIRRLVERDVKGAQKDK
jgi:hypothetical protein